MRVHIIRGINVLAESLDAEVSASTNIAHLGHADDAAHFDWSRSKSRPL